MAKPAAAASSASSSALGLRRSGMPDASPERAAARGGPDESTAMSGADCVVPLPALVERSRRVTVA